MVFSIILTRTLLLSSVLLAALTHVRATRSMRRPADYMDHPRKFSTGSAEPQLVHRRTTAGKVQAAYFTDWSIYGANFQPTDIIPSDMTHIIYAFADVSPDTGVIALADSWADTQKHYPGDSWDDSGNNLYGCLKQMYLLKLAHRRLKVLLSVGGYTYSQDGHFAFVASPGLRAAFVASAVRMLENLGLDGLDVDFEYASTPALAQGFAELLTELRAAFDALAAEKGDTVPYQLTIAAPAGWANYQYLLVPQMDAALTYWNLMAYDYAGSWLAWADNQANLYGGVRTNVSTDKAISWYVENGATPAKIIMGVPLYGRAFEKTAGLGAPYDGIGPGTIQAGIYSYSDLPLAGAQVFENGTDVSSYAYDAATQELVSYDTPGVATLKAQYVVAHGLGGSMFWDLSTDKAGADSLVANTARVYGALDETLNHINYPDSEWANIANNMGQGASPTSVPSSSSSPTSASPTPTTTPPAGSGQCAGVSAWAPAATYTGGMKATYSGDLWTAKWWTAGDTPGGAAGVWTDDGAC